MGKAYTSAPDAESGASLDIFITYGNGNLGALGLVADDAGKNAHYLLRWVDPTAETGPWSETATATIGA
jgi:hypothetical protein